MNHDLDLLTGPFRSKEAKENIRQQLPPRARRPIDHAAFRREMSAYFERRTERLRIVKTTVTPRGQTIDWIPIEAQHPAGVIASPPPLPRHPRAWEKPHGEQPDIIAEPELEAAGVERGPRGTVPILRKNLAALGHTKSLKQYLSKSRGHRIMNLHGAGFAAPEEGGSHRYANSGQPVICFGGEGQLSCFDPYLESSDDFSLIQIGLSNSDLGYLQTVEAGWQEFQDLTGDWVPHLFVYYTTNGYSNDDDNQGGYNTDVDGWVQYDDTIFPGSTFTPYSTRGGDQRKITIKYQLYQGNWWFACQGRWVGYYPAPHRLLGRDLRFRRRLGTHHERYGQWLLRRGRLDVVGLHAQPPGPDRPRRIDGELRRHVEPLQQRSRHVRHRRPLQQRIGLGQLRLSRRPGRRLSVRELAVRPSRRWSHAGAMKDRA